MKKTDWIKTEVQVPPEKHPYVLAIHKGTQKILCYNDHHKCWDDEEGDDYFCDTKDVEWWMPLPDYPEIFLKRMIK